MASWRALTSIRGKLEPPHFLMSGLWPPLGRKRVNEQEPRQEQEKYKYSTQDSTTSDRLLYLSAASEHTTDSKNFGYLSKLN